MFLTYYFIKVLILNKLLKIRQAQFSGRSKNKFMVCIYNRLNNLISNVDFYERYWICMDTAGTI